MNLESQSPQSESPRRRYVSWPIVIAGVVLLITIVTLSAMGELEFRPPWTQEAAPKPFVGYAGNAPSSETEKFREMVEDAIGPEGLMFRINNDLKFASRKIIQVEFDIDDNLTDGFVKRGAMMDIESILKAVDESGIYCGEVTVRGSFPLTDKYGSAKKEVVVKATYSGTTIDQVNWSGFLTDNVYKIADDLWIHPAFRD